MPDTVEYEGIVSGIFNSILTTDEILMTIENGVGSGRIVRVHSIVEGQRDQSQLFQRRVIGMRHAAVASGGTVATKTKFRTVAGTNTSDANVVIRQGRAGPPPGAQTVITPGDAGDPVWQAIIPRWAAANQGMWANGEDFGPFGEYIELAEGEALSFTQTNVNAIPAVTVANTNSQANLQFVWEEVTVAGGPQNVTLTGIPSAEAFGAVDLSQTVDLTGIPSAEAFGAPDFAQRVGLTGIASAEAFGAITMFQPPLGQTVTLTGIATAEAIGGITDLNQRVSLTGITSAEAVGAIDLNQRIQLTGITSSEIFGGVDLSQRVLLTGIASAETFGVMTVGITPEAPSVTTWRQLTGYGQ